MELQERLGLTFIVVTHDQEAMTVADGIGVMSSRGGWCRSRRRRWSTTAALALVAGFIGDVNLLEGRVTTSGLGDATWSRASRRADRGVAWRISRRHPCLGGAAAGEVRARAPKRGRRRGRSFSGHVSEIGYLGGTSICRIWLANGIE